AERLPPVVPSFAHIGIAQLRQPSLASAREGDCGYGMAFRTDHHLVAGTFLLGSAGGRRLVGHDGWSRLLPSPQRRLRFPEAESERLAGLTVRKHVQARKSGLTLQSRQRLLEPPPNCSIKVLG